MDQEDSTNINRDKIYSKPIVSFDIRQINYLTINDALDQIKEILEEHQKLIGDKQVLSNIVFIHGYTFG